MSAWAFGLPGPSRTLLKRAICDLLAPLSIAGGGWLQAVAPIGFLVKGPGDELGIDLLWSELNGRTPAIAVATAKAVIDPGGAPGRRRRRQQVDLYLVSNHRRGITDGRTIGDVSSSAGKSADPGLDAALELTWTLLLDADLGLGDSVTGLQMIEEDEIIADTEKTIWHQLWQVWVDVDVDRLRATTRKIVGLRSIARVTGPDSSSPIAVADTELALTTPVR